MERATGPHDLGGLRPGPIDVSDRPWKAWERECHGVVWLLVQKGLMSLDELRRATEALPGYASMSYYEKWASASAAIAIERGTFTHAELDAQMGPDPATLDNTARFNEGDCVRVRPEDAAIRWRRPHLRTPGYIFGQVGVIERPCAGLFGNPELKAFREEGPRQPLYRVRFHQSDVWELYQGDANDTLEVEVYQPWLEPATQEQLQQQRDASKAAREAQQAQLGHAHAHEHGHGHEHEHGHSHEHGEHHHHHHHHHHEHHSHHHHEEGVIDHGDHVHEARGKVEQAAVELEGDETDGSTTYVALKKLLLAKGVITPQELRSEVEAMDARGTRGEGPRLVARAWLDPEFKARLLQDTSAAAAEMGISTSNFTPKPGSAAAAAPPPAPTGSGPQPKSGTILTAVENVEGKVHNLIVCTLCSCYPISILGMSPHWYRGRAYRARAVRDPRGLLAEFGTTLAPGTAIRVHDSTADLRYMVIPARPAGTEGWSEEQLAKLVTRDSMIGVAPALTPQQLQELEARRQQAAA
ncbi:hypothetical protein OEZ85_003011 [Tetradesmus obliquus]|uniref:nitrile hydratase n=1 Tax=Tetradesmus obliquus TaxID=3088 RepID=A0ABY8TZD0_TETOB|nr:hypothetical protein OEZ85_003011 [Tetradesmus obliquus]